LKIIKCPAVVANLWDVTNKDMEQFTTQLLEDWTSDTKKVLTGVLRDCRTLSRDFSLRSTNFSSYNLQFPNLNGSAPVCYGFPVKVKHALQLKPNFENFDSSSSADLLASRMSGLQISKGNNKQRVSDSKSTNETNKSPIVIVDDEIMTDVKTATTTKEEKKSTATTTSKLKEEKKTTTATVSRSESSRSIRANEEKKPSVPKLSETTTTGSENAIVNSSSTSKSLKQTTTSTRTKSTNSISTIASKQQEPIPTVGMDEENVLNTKSTTSTSKNNSTTTSSSSTTTTTTTKLSKETKQQENNGNNIAIGKEPLASTSALTDSKRATRSSARTKK